MYKMQIDVLISAFITAVGAYVKNASVAMYILLIVDIRIVRDNDVVMQLTLQIGLIKFR